MAWVLDHQFVELSPEDLRVFKTIVGSGMGLESSGDTNDICFYEKAEHILFLSRRSKRGMASSSKDM